MTPQRSRITISYTIYLTNVLVPQITVKLDITAITNTTIICLMNGVLKIGRITNSFYHHCFLPTNQVI